MKIGAVIQARASSQRFPNKVLKELPFNSRITVLGQIIRRLKISNQVNTIIVVTSTDRCDYRIVRVAKKEKVGFLRGSRENVLSRYYLAAKSNKLDIIVRITGDCPCIDPEIVDSVVKRHIKARADYTSNALKRTYPTGLDVEVFNFDVLEKTYKNAHREYEKEHVTPYMSSNRGIFKIINVAAPKKLYAPGIRITLDTEEDYALLCLVFDYLYKKNPYFNAYEIVNLFKEKPWLRLINKKVTQKKIFFSLRDELKQARNILDLQDLDRARDFIKKYL